MSKEPVFILVAGGSCSGKSELAKSLGAGEQTIKIFSMDDFYKDVASERLKRAATEICELDEPVETSEWYAFYQKMTSEQLLRMQELVAGSFSNSDWDQFYQSMSNEQLSNLFSNYNFDHPGAFDWETAEKFAQELYQKAKNAKSGDVIDLEIPNYSFIRHRCIGVKKVSITVTNLPVIIGFEGIYSLYRQTFIQLAKNGVRVFIDSTSYDRLARRILRDPERGRTVNDIIRQMTDQVEPAYKQFVEPTRTNAHFILPNPFTTREIRKPMNGDFESPDSAMAEARDTVMAFIRSKCL